MFMVPSSPANLAEKMDTPLWMPKSVHKDPKKAGNTSKRQLQLREARIEKLDNIVDWHGTILPWNPCSNLHKD